MSKNLQDEAVNLERSLREALDSMPIGVRDKVTILGGLLRVYQAGENKERGYQLAIIHVMNYYYL